MEPLPRLLKRRTRISGGKGFERRQELVNSLEQPRLGGVRSGLDNARLHRLGVGQVHEVENDPANASTEERGQRTDAVRLLPVVYKVEPGPLR